VEPTTYIPPQHLDDRAGPPVRTPVTVADIQRRLGETPRPFADDLNSRARADVGDVVRVELRLDRASREEPVPADLRLALKQNPAARRAFDEFTTGHRRHFIEWFDSAKGSDTRIRRLGRAIDFLLARELSPRTKAAQTRRK